MEGEGIEDKGESHEVVFPLSFKKWLNLCGPGETLLAERNSMWKPGRRMMYLKLRLARGQMERMAWGWQAS